MGLFDYIECDYPLPDGFDPKVARATFQTKDTPSQQLDTYVITADGRLLCEGCEVTDFHGDIRFYTSNWAGWDDARFITEGDAAPFACEYVARFTDGRVSRITGGDTTAETFANAGRHVAAREFRKKGAPDA